MLRALFALLVPPASAYRHLLCHTPVNDDVVEELYTVSFPPPLERTCVPRCVKWKGISALDARQKETKHALLLVLAYCTPTCPFPPFSQFAFGEFSFFFFFVKFPFFVKLARKSTLVKNALVVLRHHTAPRASRKSDTLQERSKRKASELPADLALSRTCDVLWVDHPTTLSALLRQTEQPLQSKF